MNPIFLNAKAINETDKEQLDQFGKRLADEGVKLHLGLTSHEGQARMALQFHLGDTPCMLLPSDGTVLIDGAVKTIEFSYDDSWVTLRKKIGAAEFIGDGMPQTPGPQLVQWLFQRMKEESDSSEDWTWEECMRLALTRIGAPPHQPSAASEENDADAS